MSDSLVTDISVEKRGASVTVNGEVTLWFPRDAWRERALTAGEAVDLEELKAWLLPRQYPEALNVAVALLAARPRSSGEIRKRLADRRYMEETVEMALYKLEKERLLDDETFAREWAAACARRQMGRHRIMRDLLQKGVAPDAAQSALDALDADEGDEAAVLLAQKLLRRYEREEDARKAMQKLMAAMARRGYGFAQSQRAVQEALRRAEDAE